MVRMLQTVVTIAVDVGSDVFMCCSGRQISPFRENPFIYFTHKAYFQHLNDFFAVSLCPVLPISAFI